MTTETLTANPEIANPEIANPEIANPETVNTLTSFIDEIAANPEIANPEIANPETAQTEIKTSKFIAGLSYGYGTKCELGDYGYITIESRTAKFVTVNGKKSKIAIDFNGNECCLIGGNMIYSHLFGDKSGYIEQPVLPKVTKDEVKPKARRSSAKPKTAEQPEITLIKPDQSVLAIAAQKVADHLELEATKPTGLAIGLDLYPDELTESEMGDLQSKGVLVVEYIRIEVGGHPVRIAIAGRREFHLNHPVFTSAGVYYRQIKAGSEKLPWSRIGHFKGHDVVVYNDAKREAVQSKLHRYTKAAIESKVDKLESSAGKKLEKARAEAAAFGF